MFYFIKKSPKQKGGIQNDEGSTSIIWLLAGF